MVNGKISSQPKMGSCFLDGVIYSKSIAYVFGYRRVFDVISYGNDSLFHENYTVIKNL